MEYLDPSIVDQNIGSSEIVHLAHEFDNFSPFGHITRDKRSADLALLLDVCLAYAVENNFFVNSATI